MDLTLSLTPLQRAVLATDGTLSTLIESFTGDTVACTKLDEQVRPARASAQALDVAPEQDVLERTVLLRGIATLGPIIYAVSQLVLDRLEPPVRRVLLTTDTPIGKLLLARRTETFRELLEVRSEPAAEVGSFLDVDPDAPLLVRTYRIFAGGRPLMTITEKFPYERFPQPDPRVTCAATPSSTPSPVG